MVPVCFPSKISSTTGLREAVVFALSSVTGLVRWTDYIPVKLVASADAALEGRTDAGGFIPMGMLSSNTGLMGWVDYLPVYVDNSATDAWAITATGFIPYAASGGGGVAQAIKIATYGDSRATLFSGAVTGDMYNGTNRPVRISLTNHSTAFLTLPMFMSDVVLTADGGASGEQTTTWNSATRGLGSKGPAAIAALDWDIMLIQFGTNDVANLVTTAGTRDSTASSVIANIQATISYFLATGRKVIWQTTMQRTSAGFVANQALRQECTDIINYGNGGAITGLKAWCEAQPEYGTRLYVHDIQALVNAGGVSTGAYADIAWLGDNTHPGYYGARRIAKDLALLLRTIYTSRGVPTLHRSTGNNLVPAVSASYVGGESTSNCSKSAITYGTDANGRPYGEVTITPNNVASGNYKVEVWADVGSNAGRTPVGGTVVVDDLVQSRVLLTIDDGSGGVSVVNNLVMYTFCSYIGGTPATQSLQNGQNSQGSSLQAEPDIEAQYVVQPMKLTAGSSLIGPPSASTGLRMYLQFYFGITPTPFRVRWTAPEIRKVA